MRLEAEKLFARSGRDASRQSAPQRMEGGSFTYTTVVRAAAWDRRSGRLLLLLDKGIAGSTYALDLLDPASGA